MLGLFRRTIIENQLKRSLLVQKLLMFGLYKYQTSYDSHRSSKQHNRLITVSINFLFADEIDYAAIAKEGIDRSTILTYAQTILNSDSDVERVIVLNLNDILTQLLALNKRSKKTANLQVRLEERLAPYRDKYPELFQDYDEQAYGAHANYFAETYYPEMASKIKALFEFGHDLNPKFGKPAFFLAVFVFSFLTGSVVGSIWALALGISVLVGILLGILINAIAWGYMGQKATASGYATYTKALTALRILIWPINISLGILGLLVWAIRAANHH